MGSHEPGATNRRRGAWHAWLLLLFVIVIIIVIIIVIVCVLLLLLLLLLWRMVAFWLARCKAAYVRTSAA